MATNRDNYGHGRQGPEDRTARTTRRQTSGGDREIDATNRSTRTRIGRRPKELVQFVEAIVQQYRPTHIEPIMLTTGRDSDRPVVLKIPSICIKAR